MLTRSLAIAALLLLAACSKAPEVPAPPPTPVAIQEAPAAPTPAAARKVEAVRPPSTESLISRSRDLTSDCSNGNDQACEQNIEVISRLYSRGMCYGEHGQGGSAKTWHRCGPNSCRTLAC